MPVGKGSIARVAKAKAESSPENVMQAEMIAEEPTGKEISAVESVKKKPAVQRKKASSIHEKKFEAVSQIHCELPVHLL